MCISPSWLVSKLCFFPIQLWWFPMVPQCRQTSIHRFFSGETVKPPIYFPFGFGRGSHWFASTCFLIPQFCRGSLWRKPRKFFYHHMLWYPLWGQDSQRLKASAFLVSIWRSSMRSRCFFGLHGITKHCVLHWMKIPSIPSWCHYGQMWRFPR